MAIHAACRTRQWDETSRGNTALSSMARTTESSSTYSTTCARIVRHATCDRQSDPACSSLVTASWKSRTDASLTGFGVQIRSDASRLKLNRGSCSLSSSLAAQACSSSVSVKANLTQISTTAATYCPADRAIFDWCSAKLTNTSSPNVRVSSESAVLFATPDMAGRKEDVNAGAKNSPASSIASTTSGKTLSKALEDPEAQSRPMASITCPTQGCIGNGSSALLTNLRTSWAAQANTSGLEDCRCVDIRLPTSGACISLTTKVSVKSHRTRSAASCELASCC
mmetsp:Transcript_27834/g.66952  ORF Transcript_27834/g.66952 Transcript_27834/m.66952 type:complete len:282 (-) Transcript_27834:399-1244(-)